MNGGYIHTDYEGKPVDSDSAALAAIFFEDGMTYLRLGDLPSACEMLGRAYERDPTQGLFLAYHAYSIFRRDQGEEEDGLREETMQALQRAVQISPQDPDVYLIVARFHLKCFEVEEAERALEQSRYLNPSNPNLASVERAIARARE